VTARKWTTLCCLLAHLGGVVLTPGVFAQTIPENPPAPETGDEEDTWLDDRSWLVSSEDSPDVEFEESEKNYTFGIIGSAVGLVAGVGLAVWVKREADKRYDEYLITADTDQQVELFDSAQRYDRATIIGWGLAQVSFVALLYFLTREGGQDLVPVEGEPLVRTYQDGVELGFRFTP
jgi:hypothetical protein